MTQLIRRLCLFYSWSWRFLSEETLDVTGHKCRAVFNVTSGAPIVFMHGFSYTSDIWQRISLIGLLTSKRLSFLALDMPYGLKSECRPKTHDTETNVNVTREAIRSVFGSRMPVLVGASIGGHVALSYAARFPVKGLLLVAPSRALEKGLSHAYNSFRFPVRIIWGSEDNIISGEDMRELSGLLPNVKLVVYDGAGHSAYLAQPDRFKRDVLELYALAEQQVF
jgi:pimeloyl-ACP methyl ester carboxylesterase